MELDALTPSRLQFAFTIAFHVVFPSFTLGLASFLAVLEGLWLATRRSVFRTLGEFWRRVFAVSLALSVLSALSIAMAVSDAGAWLAPEGPALACLTAGLATALAVAGASAWRLLRDSSDEASGMALRMAVGTAATLAPMALLVGGPVAGARPAPPPFLDGGMWVFATVEVVTIALGLWGGWLSWRGPGIDRSRPFLWACLAMGPTGFIALVLGWTLAGPAHPWTEGAPGALLAAQMALMAVGGGYILRLLARGPRRSAPSPVS